MTGKLDGKVAIVTGGGTGIGEAICHKFANPRPAPITGRHQEQGHRQDSLVRAIEAR